MSKWQDVLTLITLTPAGKDESGYVLPPTEHSRTVFCDRVSIGQSEFYKATETGIKVEAKCRVRTVDFGGETLCEIDGRRYGILRTYSPNNGEITELTLTDIKQIEA